MKLNKNVIWPGILTLFLSASQGTVKKKQELIQLRLNKMFPENIDRKKSNILHINKTFCLSPDVIILFQISSNDVWQFIQASLQLTGL